MTQKKIPQNPSENINILSYCTFAWFIPTMIKIYRKTLTEEDLFEPTQDQKSKFLGDLLQKNWEREKARAKPSLLRALWRTFALKLLAKGCIGLITETIIRTAQCLSFVMLLKCYTKKTEPTSGNGAYLYAALLTATNFMIIIGIHSYVYGSEVIGMQMRVACCSLIYRKCLKLSSSSTGDTNLGKLMNLITNDVGRFDYAATDIHSTWLGPLQLVVVTVILYTLTGWTGIIGLAICALVVPIQLLIGRRISKLRQKTAKITDERINVISEILAGIQLIKMYNWEEHFAEMVHKIRQSEIRLLRHTASWFAVISGSNHFIPKLAVFVSIISNVLIGYVLTPISVFTIVFFYAALKLPLNIFLPRGIPRCAEGITAIKRIEAFLLTEELGEPESTLSTYNYQSFLQEGNDKKKVFVSLKNVSVKWEKNEFSDNILERLNAMIEGPNLVAVIGSVGSGKTSLLKTILNEMHLNNGEIKVAGTVSYSSQDAWFFGGTIKENILFGQPYDEDRYKNVVRVCALEKDFLLFPHGDLTIVAENGNNLSGGQKARINLARAVFRMADIYLLDDPLAAVDTTVGEYIFDQCIYKFLGNKCTILATNQLQFLKYVKYIYILENGKIRAEGTFKKLQDSRLGFLKAIVGDNDVNAMKNKVALEEVSDFHEKLKEEDSAEGRHEGTVKFRVYKMYLQSGAKCYAHILMMIGIIAFGVALCGFDASLGYWSNVDYAMVLKNGTSTTASLTRNDYLCIFSSILASVIILALISLGAYYMLFVNCSKNLHKRSFEKIIYAPMNFFHANPAGRILNRFSRDLGLLDDFLPLAAIDTITTALPIFGVVIITAIIHYWLSIIMLPVLVACLILRQLYVPCSVAIKRLEGVTKSPICSHMKTTYKGLCILRAYKKQAEYVGIFDRLQDAHTSSFFMYLTSIHTIGIWIDILCVFLVFIVTFSFFFIGDSLAGTIGLAITQSLTLISMTQYCIRQSCEVSVTMTSAERLSEYLQLETDGEDSKREVIPGKSWPDHGAIEFKDVSLRYDSSASPVLRSINIKIEPHKKVGIVGRTGAGKSSLTLALFQLAYTEGAILIDDVNIKEVPLNVLRSNISIIPQEPLLFSDTIRKNLDPFDEYDDSRVWNALAKVELKEVVAKMPEGLLTIMFEGGSNLSVGQRQLVCLARAIMKDNKILIMDEATANVDPNTDLLIQSAINRNFKDCTVLTIAHRLHTVIDNDLVLVMDAGEVKEFDHPYLLLQRKGLFYDMVQKTGEAMSKNLHQRAEEVYRTRAIR